jgi:cyanophycinase
MIPKGKLIAVGGAEERNTESKNKLEVLRRILKEARGKNTIIEVIPSASGIPQQIGNEYHHAFTHLGCKEVRIMPIRNRKDVHKKEYLQRIAEADAVMFSGGNQSRLPMIFDKTEILDLLKKRLQEEEGFVIAGTSAGAMAQSMKMINGGAPAEALKHGKAQMIHGLGFIDTAIIDSHFINRGRFGRLMVAVAEHPEQCGIGVGEDTGVIIRENRYLEVIGTGQVVLVDARKLRYNSIIQTPGKMVNLEQMIFHLLSKGMHYDMLEGRFLPQSVFKAVKA